QPFGCPTSAFPARRYDGQQGWCAFDSQSGAKRMIAGLPLSFAEPFLLLGLFSLPVLWWLLRVMPPRPRRIEFPPTRLLFDIAPKEETPSHTPWWLTTLRLLAAALVILAAAGPIWNPQTGLAGTSAPLVILLDDGWSAAASWDTRIKAADELIANADSDRRGVALVPLSEPARDITLMPAGTARVALRQLAPKPYSIERVEISGERSAGAAQLLDKRWRRRAIGIVSGSTNETAQPLLASTFYLTRALAPFADVRLGDRGAPQQAITQFLDQKLPMIVLA